MLEAVIRNLLNGREFVLTPLQPELSVAFIPQSGGGWGGVCLWCRTAASQADGRLGENPLFAFHDLLVVQVDADVAGKRYSDYGRMLDDLGNLPCKQPCPPASATTDALRKVVLGWMGEQTTPRRTVLCTPSIALETWVLVGLFPQNRLSKASDLECCGSPESQLQAQPPRRRLVRSGKKDTGASRRHAEEVGRNWPRVRRRCSEAERFSAEFLAALP
jgi:hypothetical protein